MQFMSENSTTFEPLLLVAALAISIVGSIVTMRIFARVRRSEGIKRANWLFLVGVAAGCAIWASQFVALAAADSHVLRIHEPGRALVAFLIAMAAAHLGFWIAARTQTSHLIEFGGAVLGLGIAAVFHFSANGYRLAPPTDWHPFLLAASVLCPMVFGGLATNRIARPVTRFCRYGGAIALTLSISSAFLFGAAATIVSIELSAMSAPPEVPSGVSALVAIVIVSVILAVSTTTHTIDTRTSSESDARVRHMMEHDPLTGLPNRRRLMGYLSEWLGGVEADNGKLVIVTLNLDRFKEINDVHGETAGDVVLKSVARHLAEALKDGELVARIDGDEFVAVKSGVYTHGQARSFAERIANAAAKPIEDAVGEFLIGVSCGACLFPEDAVNADDLVARSQVAMMRAKTTSSGKICFYEKKADSHRMKRSALSLDLNSAIDHGELELFYQQQNSVSTGQVVGFEALLRWHHPERGLVPPNEFIPIAEETA